VKFFAPARLLALTCALGTTLIASAQQAPVPTINSAADAASRGHLILVLPFENHSSQANVDWMSESMPAIMNRRLESAGFLPISREDRLYALDHLGLPPNFRPSRASITITARLLDVNSLSLSPPIEEQVDLPRFLDGINGLAWKLVRKIDPAYPVAEQTFVAADAKLPLSAFENYIRGLVEDTSAERIKHLKEAVRLDSTYYQAWLALGRVYFKDQQYELAAVAFGKIPRTDPAALAAAFDRGLASFYTGNYNQAQDSFAFVATQLPLSEVINNEGVAASRRNQDAVSFFQQAVIADPRDPDYHFNLALAWRRRNDTPAAIREVEDSLKLRPQDSEAQALLNTLQRPSAPVKTDASLSTPPITATTEAPAANTSGPLERIKRNYNESSFRQAAYEIDQMQAMKLETLPPAARATAFSNAGSRYLHSGLLLEAERQFQNALQADSANSVAHAGLAAIRERSGDVDAARLQAQQALQLQPNIDAHLVLARLDLQSSQLPAAANEVGQALKLEPKNSAALGIRQQLQARGQQVQ
jgi:tetratricopeptide (TPR) repeat protein